MSKTPNKSAYPFADEVRTEVCAERGLKLDFAPYLPTPERFLQAMDMYATITLNHVGNQLRSPVDADISSAAFEISMARFLKSAENMLKDAYELKLQKSVLLDGTPENQRDIYKNILDDTVVIFLDILKGETDEEPQKSRPRTPNDMFYQYQHEIIIEMNIALDAFYRKPKRPDLRVIDGGKGGPKVR